MGKFIKIVLIIYVIYYAVMIIFDLFIKKSNRKKDSDDGIQLDIEGFHTEDVDMTDEEIAIEKKLEEEKKSFDDDDDDYEEPEPVKQDGIEMEVESQGFTTDEFKKLLGETHDEGNSFISRLNTQSTEQTNSI